MGSWTYTFSAQETAIGITSGIGPDGNGTALFQGDPGGPVPATYLNGVLRIEARGMVMEGRLTDQGVLSGWAKTRPPFSKSRI